MTNQLPPDFSDHEEEATPFYDVLRRLLAAKPAPKKAAELKQSDPAPDH